jgi:hypothetical protein
MRETGFVTEKTEKLTAPQLRDLVSLENEERDESFVFVQYVI